MSYIPLRVKLKLCNNRVKVKCSEFIIKSWKLYQINMFIYDSIVKKKTNKILMVNFRVLLFPWKMSAHKTTFVRQNFCGAHLFFGNLHLSEPTTRRKLGTLEHTVLDFVRTMSFCKCTFANLYYIYIYIIPNKKQYW